MAAADERPARLRALLDLWWDVVEPVLAAPPLLDGETAMAQLGLAPGPQLGMVLRTVQQARIRGEIGTAAAALALARRLLEEHQGTGAATAT